MVGLTSRILHSSAEPPNNNEGISWQTGSNCPRQVIAQPAKSAAPPGRAPTATNHGPPLWRPGRRRPIRRRPWRLAVVGVWVWHEADGVAFGFISWRGQHHGERVALFSAFEASAGRRGRLQADSPPVVRPAQKSGRQHGGSLADQAQPVSRNCFFPYNAIAMLKLALENVVRLSVSRKCALYVFIMLRPKAMAMTLYST